MIILRFEISISVGATVGSIFTEGVEGFAFKEAGEGFVFAEVGEGFAFTGVEEGSAFTGVTEGSTAIRFSWRVGAPVTILFMVPKAKNSKKNLLRRISSSLEYNGYWWPVITQYYLWLAGREQERQQTLLLIQKIYE